MGTQLTLKNLERSRKTKSDPLHTFTRYFCSLVLNMLLLSGTTALLLIPTLLSAHSFLLSVVLLLFTIFRLATSPSLVYWSFSGWPTPDLLADANDPS